VVTPVMYLLIVRGAPAGAAPVAAAGDALAT
jgi:hypothetical protein